ncbi:Flp pilus assembly protein CpaB [Methylophilus sp. 5]|uniref:Flp pilus assembly protein CpaB n=1 Tax=Methylophilus sp. 5 TaxID=1112274 RepID=UPI000490D02A|nr:Flp pilus assembly protein CpaB [Methylophilus sp. 5]
MNSTFLRVLAVLMMVAGLVTAYLGYRISNKAPVDSLKVIVPTYSQVVAQNNIAAGHVLTVDDLKVTTTQQYDKRTFSEPQSLIGKVSATAVLKDTPFKATHFPVGNHLGQALAAHERAVAIKVNEVVGVGGFIKPGDHVDVLLYLRTDRETGDVSSGQVVLANVKVLAYGTLTSEPEAEPVDETTPAASQKLGISNSRLDDKNGKDSRSAILAVRAEDTSKLMLADSSGTLRLALRGESLPGSDAPATTDNHFVRLGEVSRPSSATVAAPAQTIAAPAKVSVKKHVAAKRERVIVHRGDQIEVVNVMKQHAAKQQ